MQYATQDVNKLDRGSPPLDVQHQPPFSLEAEQALLGGLLLRNDSLDQVVDFLETAHFWDKLHGQIYDHAARLIGRGENANPITLMKFFERAEPIDGQTTVAQYLGQLGARASSLNIRDYGRVVYDLSVRRELILLGEDILSAAYDSPIDFPPKEQIEEAEMRLFALVERRERGGQASLAAATETALKTVRAAHTGKKTGVETGLADLDKKLGGLQPSDLVILAGRPSMGKSALATNIARRAALDKVPVGFFSLEMSAEQTALRILGDVAGLSPDRMRRGKLSQDELAFLGEAAPDVGGLPIFIDDTGGLSIAQLSSRARRMKRRRGLGLLIVDYLQLMHAGRKTENRVQDVAAISVGLKALAKELQIPVLALSQLSRGVEGRDNKRPQLADLRESGSIEQDADVVLFVYRDEYYIKRDEPEVGNQAKYTEWQTKLREVAGKAEVIIGKQRQGATGIVKLAFSEDLMRFSNLATSERVSEARHV